MHLTFVYLTGFVSDWKHFRLTDEDLRSLEQELLRKPDAGAVMAGTGGLRKVRFAPPSRHGGKSGAFRVGYVHFRVADTVVLMSLFAKADQANLTTEQKARFRAVIRALEPGAGR